MPAVTSPASAFLLLVSARLRGMNVQIHIAEDSEPTEEIWIDPGDVREVGENTTMEMVCDSRYQTVRDHAEVMLASGEVIANAAGQDLQAVMSYYRNECLKTSNLQENEESHAETLPESTDSMTHYQPQKSYVTSNALTPTTSVHSGGLTKTVGRTQPRSVRTEWPMILVIVVVAIMWILVALTVIYEKTHTGEPCGSNGELFLDDGR